MPELTSSLLSHMAPLAGSDKDKNQYDISQFGPDGKPGSRVAPHMFPREAPNASLLKISKVEGLFDMGAF